MNIISDSLFILALVWLLIVLLGYLVPYAYGLPPTPTRGERIRKALQMAKLESGETLYDLGAGDGRVVIMAAKEFGARGVGIEAGPVQCIQAWAGSLFQGVKSQVRIRWGNFYKVNLREADVVFAYLTSEYVPRLETQLRSQLRDGARVVTISFDFPNWEPDGFDERELIFLYKMPPNKGDLSTYLEKRVDKARAES